MKKCEKQEQHFDDLGKKKKKERPKTFTAIVVLIERVGTEPHSCLANILGNSVRCCLHWNKKKVRQN